MVIVLGETDVSPPTIREAHGLTEREIWLAHRIVEAHLTLLRVAWRQYHG